MRPIEFWGEVEAFGASLSFAGLKKQLFNNKGVIVQPLPLQMVLACLFFKLSKNMRYCSINLFLSVKQVEYLLGCAKGAMGFPPLCGCSQDRLCR